MIAGLSSRSVSVVASFELPAYPLLCPRRRIISRLGASILALCFGAAALTNAITIAMDILAHAHGSKTARSELC
jgi:hypothetical protein